jgi:hypothetical protein
MLLGVDHIFRAIHVDTDLDGVRIVLIIGLGLEDERLALREGGQYKLATQPEAIANNGGEDKVH